LVPGTELDNPFLRTPGTQSEKQYWGVGQLKNRNSKGAIGGLTWGKKEGRTKKNTGKRNGARPPTKKGGS